MVTACDYIVYTKGQQVPRVVEGQICTTREDAIGFVKSNLPSLSAVKDALFVFTVDGVVVTDEPSRWASGMRALRARADTRYIRIDVIKQETSVEDESLVEADERITAMVDTDVSAVKGEVDEKKPLPKHKPATDWLRLHIRYTSPSRSGIDCRSKVASFAPLLELFKYCARHFSEKIGQERAASDLVFSMDGVQLDGQQTCAEAGVVTGARIDVIDNPGLTRGPVLAGLSTGRGTRLSRRNRNGDRKRNDVSSAQDVPSEAEPSVTVTYTSSTSGTTPISLNFAFQPSKTLVKLFRPFSEHVQREADSLSFTYDGRLLKPGETFEAAGFVDGARIDVVDREEPNNGSDLAESPFELKPCLDGSVSIGGGVQGENVNEAGLQPDPFASAAKIEVSTDGFPSTFGQRAPSTPPTCASSTVAAPAPSPALAPTQPPTQLATQFEVVHGPDVDAAAPIGPAEPSTRAMGKKRTVEDNASPSDGVAGGSSSGPAVPARKKVKVVEEKAREPAAGSTEPPLSIAVTAAQPGLWATTSLAFPFAVSTSFGFGLGRTQTQIDAAKVPPSDQRGANAEGRSTAKPAHATFAASGRTDLPKLATTRTGRPVLDRQAVVGPSAKLPPMPRLPPLAVDRATARDASAEDSLPSPLLKAKLYPLASSTAVAVKRQESPNKASRVRTAKKPRIKMLETKASPPSSPRYTPRTRLVRRLLGKGVITSANLALLEYRPVNEPPFRSSPSASPKGAPVHKEEDVDLLSSSSGDESFAFIPASRTYVRRDLYSDTYSEATLSALETRKQWRLDWGVTSDMSLDSTRDSDDDSENPDEEIEPEGEYWWGRDCDLSESSDSGDEAPAVDEMQAVGQGTVVPEAEMDCLGFTRDEIYDLSDEDSNASNASDASDFYRENWFDLYTLEDATNEHGTGRFADAGCRSTSPEPV